MNHLKLQLKNVKPELLAFHETIHGMSYDRQYLLPLPDYTIIVGVNNCDLVEPDVDILSITDENDKPIEVNESELTEILTSLNYTL